MEGQVRGPTNFDHFHVGSLREACGMPVGNGNKQQPFSNPIKIIFCPFPTPFGEYWPVSAISGGPLEGREGTGPVHNLVRGGAGQGSQRRAEGREGIGAGP